VKVNNGSINVAPDGQPRTPIMTVAQATGRATGLVTTARITHATPAGFAAQADSRVDESAIVEQYLQRGIDVLLGGGARFMDAGLREDRRDLFGDFARAGYQVARDRTALAALRPDRRMLGVFSQDHLPYTLDVQADPALAARTPDLAEMTRAALRCLDAQGRGFVVQIEGGRVDHAAHANDVGALVHDQLALDDAIGEVGRFVEGRDDTLVIVTTDHGNANPGLNGSGGNFDSRGGSYGNTQKCFERLAELRRTNAWIMKELSAGSTAVQIRDRVGEASGIVLTGDEIDLMLRALRKDPAPREGYRVRNDAQITLGQLISNYTSVGWSGTQHTTDLVELAAFGPGSEAVHGLMQNTDLFGIMTRAIGVPAAKSAAS
jgi:alkaline phosphatase